MFPRCDTASTRTLRLYFSIRCVLVLDVVKLTYTRWLSLLDVICTMVTLPISNICWRTLCLLCLVLPPGPIGLRWACRLHAISRLYVGGIRYPLELPTRLNRRRLKMGWRPGGCPAEHVSKYTMNSTWERFIVSCRANKVVKNNVWWRMEMEVNERWIRRGSVEISIWLRRWR